MHYVYYIMYIINIKTLLIYIYIYIKYSIINFLFLKCIFPFFVQYIDSILEYTMTDYYYFLLLIYLDKIV